MDFLVILFGLIGFCAFCVLLFGKRITMPEGLPTGTLQFFSKIASNSAIQFHNHTHLPIGLAAGSNAFANRYQAVQIAANYVARLANFAFYRLSNNKLAIGKAHTKPIENEERCNFNIRL